MVNRYEDINKGIVALTPSFAIFINPFTEIHRLLLSEIYAVESRESVRLDLAFGWDYLDRSS